MKLKLAALVMVVLISASLVMAQPGKGGGQGGQRGGGMRGMMGAEREWSVLCFEVKITPEQIAKLRPTFQWAWDEQKTAIKSAMASHSFDSAGKVMATVQSTVDSRVKIVLTKTQQAQLAKYKAAQEAARAKMRSQMGGGMGGGQGKGGGQHK